MSERAIGVVIVIFACALFASTGVVARMAIDGGLDPAQVAAVRTYGGALLLLPFVVRAWRSFDRSMAGPVVAYALIGVFASQGLYFEAISRMDVALALVISYIAPLPVALYRRLRLGERLPVWAYGAMLVAVGGLALAVLGGNGVGELTPLGLALAFLCMATFAVMLILGPKQPARVGPFARAGAPLLLAGAAWFAVVPVWTVPWGEMGAAVPLSGVVDVAVPLWATIAWVVVVGSAIAFAIILAGTARVGSGTASMLGMTEPIVGSLLAWVVLGQALTGLQALGILVTVLAVGVVEHARTRRAGPIDVPDPLAALADPERR